MKCPNCHFDNPSSNKFCQNCGTQLPAAVPPPPPPNPMRYTNTSGGIGTMESLRGIKWSVVDWHFVRQWVLYNLLAVLLFFAGLAIVGAVAYQTVVATAQSLMTNAVQGVLGGLLGGGYNSFGSSSSGLGGMVALAWLIGLGLIALYGVLVGWAQARFLRNRFPSVNWIAVSVFGAFAAAVGVYLLWRIGFRSSFFILIGAGAAFSAAQWYGLRNHLQAAWIWIAGNAAGGIVLWLFMPLIETMVGSTFAGGAVDMLSGDLSGLILSALVPTLIFGALVAGVTGVTMNYVFQKQDAS